MPKFPLAVQSLAAAGLLVLAACSEQTQNHASDTASSAADDVSGAASDIGDAASTGAEAAGKDAGKAIEKLGNQLGDKLETAAAKVGRQIKRGTTDAKGTILTGPPASATPD
jgi:hypothetical protein